MAKSKCNTILAIRLSAMGDVAMTVPVLVAFKRTYPNVKLFFLTKPHFKPIIEQITGIEVIGADTKKRYKGLFGLWQLYGTLNGKRVDAVADLHHVLRSNVLKLFFKLNGIPVCQIDKGRKEKKALTRKEDKVFKPLKTTHQRYADVFKALGYPVQLELTDVLSKLPIPENIENYFGNGKRTIGIAPFAAFKGKQYPLALMEEVLARLNAENEYHVLLFGGGHNEEVQLEAWASKYVNSTNLAGKMPFAQELQVISNLQLMVAMDSGNAHLAAMYGVPTVTLWGVTHPYAGFYPFGQPKENALLADRKKYPEIPTSVYGNTYPTGYENVMETIPPKKVIAKIKEVLARN